ncbi:hypothetical protein SAMN04487995_4594 [Dyadobacter koreensis]|uniref:Uncharacterized protein n=1 Tax=Dyadobacter koreensis TaxID=408657 RepID=A0A1H6YWT1_9BACT|nr:hypothetical protein SAMN04487995_4594 [Dyadobacter koreensis]
MTFNYLGALYKEYPVLLVPSTLITLWFEKVLLSIFYDRNLNKSHIKAARDLFLIDYVDEI